MGASIIADTANPVPTAANSEVMVRDVRRMFILASCRNALRVGFALAVATLGAEPQYSPHAEAENRFEQRFSMSEHCLGGALTSARNSRPDPDPGCPGGSGGRNCIYAIAGQD
jgi:hypothetical protein